MVFVYVCVCGCVCVSVCVCVCACVCVFVCDVFIFGFEFYFSHPLLCSTATPEITATLSFFPLLYAESYFDPDLRRRCLPTPTSCRPRPYIVFQAALKLTGPLPSGYLSSGGISLPKAPAVPPLLHPPDSVFVGYTAPCPWRHGG